MTATLLMLHGHHFKPGHTDLEALWVEALRAGIERDHADKTAAFDAANKELVYYGDATNELLQRRGATYDPRLDTADRRNALKALRDRLPKKFRRTSYERLPGKTPLKEFLVDVGAPLSRALGLSSKLTAHVVPELSEYCDPASTYRRTLIQRVMAQVSAALQRGEKVAVLAHCLGSVIAYDVFWALSRAQSADPRLRDAKIDLWITFGSPLGDEGIKARLAGAGESGQRKYPANVLNWHNIAAEDDYLAHDKRLANDYAAMLSGHLISQITDHQIYNLAVRYGRSNPHNALGYLIHPRMARLVAAWL